MRMCVRVALEQRHAPRFVTMVRRPLRRLRQGLQPRRELVGPASRSPRPAEEHDQQTEHDARTQGG